MVNARDIRNRIVDTTWSDSRKLAALKQTDRELVEHVNVKIQCELDRIIDDMLAESTFSY